MVCRTRVPRVTEPRLDALEAWDAHGLQELIRVPHILPVESAQHDPGSHLRRVGGAGHFVDDTGHRVAPRLRPLGNALIMDFWVVPPVNSERPFGQYPTSSPLRRCAASSIGTLPFSTPFWHSEHGRASSCWARDRAAWLAAVKG